MAESKIEQYSLYQTFSQNIPNENLTAAQKKFIVKKRLEFTKPQEIAFVRLVLEHYRLEDGASDISKLPYGGTEENSKITFDMKSSLMPKNLLWILYRFAKVCDEGENI